MLWRGKALLLYADFKRALYDFSAAIKLSMKQEKEVNKAHQPFPAKDYAEAYMLSGQC